MVVIFLVEYFTKNSFYDLENFSHMIQEIDFFLYNNAIH